MISKSLRNIKILLREVKQARQQSQGSQRYKKVASSQNSEEKNEKQKPKKHATHHNWLELRPDTLFSASRFVYNFRLR